MRALNVVPSLLAACFLLAGCGARSEVRCFGDVCVQRGGVGLNDPLGNDPLGNDSLGRGGSSAVIPPTRPSDTGNPNRPVESPVENDWMREPSNSPPTSGLCAQATTAQGPITISRREELRQLERCRRVDGDLTISVSRSPDLAPLSSLERVSGVLSISMSGTLAGLESLSRVGHLSLTDLDVPTLEPLQGLIFLSGSGDEDGQLTIRRSPRIENLAGLGSLREVGGVEISENARLESLDGLRVPAHLKELFIASNPNLRDLRNLASLRSFDRIDIQNNAALTQLQGLEGVVTGDSLHLSNGPALQDGAGLSGLISLRSLFIDNVGLPNLDGLVNLESAQEIVLQRNPNLTQIDALARLTLLEELVVTNNPSLLRLPSFQEISDMDRVLVRGNAGLASGPGFPGLLETRALTISENPRLTRLDGFRELRTVRSVVVSENRDLFELDLSALVDVNRLRILCNPNLPEASLAPLLSLGDVDVRGNLGSPSSCDSGSPP